MAQKLKWYKKNWVWAIIVVLVLLFGSAWWSSFRSNIDPQELSTFFTSLQAIALLIATIALIAAFSQVRETRKQLRDNRRWNQMSYAFTALPSFELFFDWEHKLDRSFVRIISRHDPISDSEVKDLFTAEHRELELLLKSYLNVLEIYCAAVMTQLADEDVARKVWGYKLVRHWVELKPYIVYCRTILHDNGIYAELEAVHNKWVSEYGSRPPTSVYSPD